MWIILLALAIVAVAVLLRIFGRVGSLPVFDATYDYAINRGCSPQEALEKAISVFVYRPPFNILNEDDIRWLAEAFSTLPDPKFLGLLFLKLDKEGDACGLKKRENVLGFIEDIRSQQLSRDTDNPT